MIYQILYGPIGLNSTALAGELQNSTIWALPSWPIKLRAGASEPTYTEQISGIPAGAHRLAQYQLSLTDLHGSGASGGRQALAPPLRREEPAAHDQLVSLAHAAAPPVLR